MKKVYKKSTVYSGKGNRSIQEWVKKILELADKEVKSANNKL